MAQTEQLLLMGAAHGVHCITIKDLVKYRVQHEPLTAAVDSHEVAGVAMHALECADGSKALSVASGDVATGRPRVVFHQVCVYLLTTKGYDHITPVRTSFDQRCFPPGVCSLFCERCCSRAVCQTLAVLEYTLFARVTSCLSTWGCKLLHQGNTLFAAA